MSTYVDGRVIGYTPMEQFQGKDGPFYNLNMIIEPLGEYPKKAYIQFMGTEKINSLQAITHLPIVRVHVNLSGREYTNDAGKTTIFKEVDGWKVEAVPAAAVQGAPAAAAAAPVNTPPVSNPAPVANNQPPQPVWNGTAWVLPAYSAPQPAAPAYAAPAPQPAWNPQQNQQPHAPMPVQSIPAPHAVPAFNPLTPQQGNVFAPQPEDLPF